MIAAIGNDIRDNDVGVPSLFRSAIARSKGVTPGAQDHGRPESAVAIPQQHADASRQNFLDPIHDRQIGDSVAVEIGNRDADRMCSRSTR